MILRGHHGVTEAERTLVQRLRVDMTLELDLRPAGLADDLTVACDYVRVFECVREIVTGETYQLLEALAERIASVVLDRFTEVAAVHVGVLKPDPPIHGTFDRVGVEICRERSR
jgi:dihydroneopterin aldolase